MSNSGRDSSDIYFEAMNLFQDRIRDRDFPAAAESIRDTFPLIPDFVTETRRPSGTFDIRSIPTLEQGGKVLALLGDDDGLTQMRQLVDTTPDLEPWRTVVDSHERDRKMFSSIRFAIWEHPGILQSEIKDHIGADDGRKVANLLSYLEKNGEIQREKAGGTYKVFLSDPTQTKEKTPQPTIHSHRRSDKSLEITELDLDSIDYVPLPRAPHKSEINQQQKHGEPATDHFEIRDASWTCISTERIPEAERPDPAFRRTYSTYSGLFMIDDLGNAVGWEGREAAAVRFDQQGNTIAEAPLRHDIYRINVHPRGDSLIAMSRSCVVHAYDDALNATLETTLAGTPEVVALQERLAIPDQSLKNCLRCVALSSDGRRYLVTGVDEAWCLDDFGNGLWGIRLPLDVKWEKIAQPSADTFTSDDVAEALDVLGLEWPVTSEDIKRNYRKFAHRYHPDRHPNDPNANETMKQINLAAEKLTGIDSSCIPAFTGARYRREIDVSGNNNAASISSDGVRIEVSIGIEGGEVNAADWIYAAAFASDSHLVYLGAYSGRIVELDSQGRARRLYDIGTVPRRIIDAGDYLYILTDTRLYVLTGHSLHALIDTPQRCDFILWGTGFALIEKNGLRLFRANGLYLGTILTTYPIRRVYGRDGNMVVETRQRRATISGIPA